MPTNEMEKIYWPIYKLKNWDKNPRSITKENFKRLKQQIEELGEFKPLIITEDGTVLGGNMRLRAYQELGWKQVWVSIVEAETEQEKLEFALADNDRAGDYDEQQLAELAMSVPDIDLSLFHIDLGKTVDLSAIVSKFGPDPEEDEPPAVEEEAVSKLGEVYQLGRHRVMCGDSTKKEDVEKLMNGQKADMVFTDPPYGVSYVGKTADALTINNDTKTGSDLLSFLKDIFTLFPLKSGGSFYVRAPGGAPGLQFRLALEEVGLSLRQVIVWVKDCMVIGRQDYQWQHEDVMYGWKDGTHEFNGGRKQTTVWEIDRPKQSREHPTMKPVNLSARAIQNSSRVAQVIYDSCLGSGSTLIACEQTNRICYGMEIDPRYVDVIRKRYAKFIDKEDQWQEVTPAIK